MARSSFSVCLVAFLICCISCSVSVDAKTWCVAQTQAKNPQLQWFLDNNCGKTINCKEILPGGSCYQPNTLRNHASYAIDLYFRLYNICDIAYATPSPTDPSFRGCIYP